MWTVLGLEHLDQRRQKNKKKSQKPRAHVSRGPGDRGPGAQGPRGTGAQGPRDPGDRRTTEPGAQGTRGPGAQGPRGPGTQAQGPRKQDKKPKKIPKKNQKKYPEQTPCPYKALKAFWKKLLWPFLAMPGARRLPGKVYKRLYLFKVPRWDFRASDKAFTRPYKALQGLTRPALQGPIRRYKAPS